MTIRPILAATMGDPAGIGPEICVRALLSPEGREVSRRFFIRDHRSRAMGLAGCGPAARSGRSTGGRGSVGGGGCSEQASR